MLRLFVTTVIATALSGCAASPEHIASFTDDQLCRGFGTYAHDPLSGGADAYKAELIRRNLISEDEWKLVSAQRIQRGMSLCALYASWGSPRDENRSVGRWGIHIQHVYGSGSRRNYVYTENGRVTAWQD